MSATRQILLLNWLEEVQSQRDKTTQVLFCENKLT